MSEPAEYQPAAPSSPVPADAAHLDDAPSNAATLPALRHLSAVSRTMHEMLQACIADASNSLDVEAVHQLRTGTRRVEATLETLAREAGTRGLGVHTEQARQRWLRQLKKVRQVSGTVRDLDVHRELLAKHYLPQTESNMDATGRELARATASADGESVVTDEAFALDRWLAARRTTAADALRTSLARREAKLTEAERQFVAAFGKRRSADHGSRRPASLLALEDYLRLMDAMPLLDAENMHDFRKGAKKARYVAEAGGDDPAAHAIAKAIKRVQDAIGDWHDWEVLAQESREALRSDGEALEAELQHRVEHHYQRALRIAATTGRRLVGEWQAVRPRTRRAR